jgi:hypothetical protein
MKWFSAQISQEKLASISREVDERIRAREKELGDVQAAERRAIGDLLDYSRASVEDISYDHYLARKFVKMFPEPDAAAGEPPPRLPVRLYQKVVRRLMRQQLVLNQSILGFLEETAERLSQLEKKLDELKSAGPPSDKQSPPERTSSGEET